MKSARFRKIFALMLASSLSALPSFSCAIMMTDQFSWSLHPMLPVQPYTNGNLGIVLPTFARSYLVIAFRYFSGRGLSAHEAAQATKMIEARLDKTDTSCDQVDTSVWTTERDRVLGVVKAPAIDATATVSTDNTSNICNIQIDGFLTAAKTLKARVAKFGATNPCIKAWIAAQDMVFQNGITSQDSIPKPLQTGDKLLQQDRAYQIAAANFYAKHFAEAQELFSQIATDKDSPWSQISRYLAVRSLIRRATTTADPFDKALLTEAGKQLKTLLADHSMSDMHADLLDLADFVADKLVPTDSSIAKEREHHLASEMVTNITSRGLQEYTNVFDKILGESDGDSTPTQQDAPLLTGVDEITEWINTFQSAKKVSKSHAVDRWKATKSVPWLIASLSVCEPKDIDSQALVIAADKISSSHPAFATVSYEVAKLLTKQKQFDKARMHIDQILVLKNLDLSSRNLLLDLRLQLARNLNEFIGNSCSKEVGSWGGGDPEVGDVDAAFAKKLFVLPLACQMYDDTIPLSILKTAAESSLYTTENRRLLSKRAWVKAVLLNNEPIAAALAANLKTLDKQYGAYYNSYLQATTSEARKFAAAFLMLHDSGSSPSLSNGMADQWWWSAKNVGVAYNVNGDDTFDIDYERVQQVPLFLSHANTSAIKVEFDKLKNGPAAPAYLADIAVGWAKSHPKDARVPEALHLAVRCTKLGCRDKVSSKLSKEAFGILHHSYPGNNWTKETPYYY